METRIIRIIQDSSFRKSHHREDGMGPLTQSMIRLSCHINAPFGPFTFGGNRANQKGAAAPVETHTLHHTT